MVLNEFNNLKWHLKLESFAKNKIELEFQIDYPAERYISKQEGAKEDTLE